MRRILTAVALSAALAVSFAPVHRHVAAYSACPANTECGWLWSSDPGHLNVVGGHTTNCQGVVLDWGTKVGYIQYIQQGCGGVIVS